MYCSKCGNEVGSGEAFCGNCGNKLEEQVRVSAGVIPQENGQGDSEHLESPKVSDSKKNVNYENQVHQGPDGVWRWQQDMNMWKNPTVLMTVWKVFMLSSAFPALLLFFVVLADDGFAEAILAFIKIFLLVAAIATGLVMIAYPIVAFAYGGKYQVVFEMDEKGISHIQMQKQFEKAQVLAWLAVMAGAAAESPVTAGAGLLAYSKNSSHSEFKKVTKIVCKPRRKVIYVNQTLEHNQIYVDPKYFDQVADYIIARCKKAKVVR